MYDINNFEEDTALYMKHIIWDCQQEKAKQDILENLGNNDVFCVKDWSQKNSTTKFSGTSTGLFWGKRNEPSCGCDLHKTR